MLLSKLKLVAALAVLLAAVCAVPGVLGYRYLQAVPAVAVLSAPDDGKAKSRDHDDHRSSSKEQPAHRSTPRPTHDDGFVAQHVTQKTFKTGKTSQVVVEMFNGTIDVQATEGSTVQVRVTEKARAATQERANQALKNIEVSVAQKGDTVHVRAHHPENQKWDHIQLEASAQLRVPAGAQLQLDTSNGNVSVTGGTGAAKVHSSNGAITVENGRGDLHLQTNNGGITVRGVTGRLDLGTSNGGVEIHAQKASVSARTSNGHIRFAGSLANGKNVFQTSNGPITLTLPANARFQVEAHTSLGHITNDFGSTRPSGQFGQELHASVGAHPEVAIELHTSIGPIHIKKQGQGPARQRTNPKRP